MANNVCSFFLWYLCIKFRELPTKLSLGSLQLKTAIQFYSSKLPRPDKNEQILKSTRHPKNNSSPHCLEKYIYEFMYTFIFQIASGIPVTVNTPIGFWVKNILPPWHNLWWYPEKINTDFKKVREKYVTHLIGFALLLKVHDQSLT